MVADSVYASLFREKYSEDAQQIPAGSLDRAMAAQSSFPPLLSLSASELELGFPAHSVSPSTASTEHSQDELLLPRGNHSLVSSSLNPKVIYQLWLKSTISVLRTITGCWETP